MKLWNDRRLQLSITRLGMEFLAILLLVGILAVQTGNNLLYLVFSLMVGVFLVSGWASRSALRDLELDSIEEGNVFARVRGGLRVRLRDGAPRRIRALEVRLEVDQGRAEAGFLRGGEGRSEALAVLQLRPERRGPCRLRNLELRTAYPFGFLEKTRRLPLDQEILILPHPRAVAPRLGLRGESLRSSPKPGESAPVGARLFREGDPLSRVHWKRTAQRGTPWVRTFEDEAPSGIRLWLDLRLWSAGAAFEKELEHLSGAILQARLQKREVSLELLSSSGKRELQGFTPAWRALALVEAEGPSVFGHPPDSAGAWPAPRLT